jgi:hypothetical protein
MGNGALIALDDGLDAWGNEQALVFVDFEDRAALAAEPRSSVRCCGVRRCSVPHVNRLPRAFLTVELRGLEPVP